MLREDVVTVFSWIFAPVSREDCESVTEERVWRSFIEAVASCVANSPSATEALNRLETPPTFEEKLQFAALHFTGGLPSSTQAIESLYVPNEDTGAFEYCGKSARYMRDLIRSLGSEVPQAFSDCPDHLSLELEISAHLLRHDAQSAREFISNRFAWLDSYAQRLSSIEADASFYAAAVGVLGAVLDAWCE